MPEIFKEENHRKSAKRWLRPALAAVLVAAIIIALTIWHPWNIPGIQSIMAKTYAATSNLQSYVINASSTFTANGSSSQQEMEVQFSSPDCYQLKETYDGQNTEIIIVGNNYYVRNSNMSTQAIDAMVTRYSSFFTKDQTLEVMNALTGMQKLPDEKIDGTDCWHYQGQVDMEHYIAEMKPDMQESRIKMGLPPLTDAEFDREMEPMLSVKIDVDLWIGKSDYVIRQWKSQQQGPNTGGATVSSNIIMKYSNFTQPITIEPPLDAQGNLLPGWVTAGSITPGSNLPVFSNACSIAPGSTLSVFSNDIVISIGAEPGYNDAAHQQITFQVTITNQSSETARNVQIVLSTMATNEVQKPQVIQAEPQNPGHTTFEPGQTETYNITWKYDGSNTSKEEISRLVDQSTVTVKFNTPDGGELTQLLYPNTPYPATTTPVPVVK